MSRTIMKNFSWQRGTGNGRLFILCLLLFVVSAFFSFWFAFPADLLQQRLLQKVSQQTGTEMRGHNASMLFPLGLELDLTIFPAIAELNDLQLLGLRVTPGWGNLLSGKVAVNLQGALAGGKIEVDAATDGWIDTSFSDIALAPLQHPDLSYQVRGLLSGQIVDVNIAADNKPGGEFSLQIDGARLVGLEKVGLSADLLIGDLSLEGKVGRQRLNLEKISLLGGVLELSGGGNIMLGETASQTRLNLNIRLHPTATTPESLLDLLSLTGVRPTVDGSYLLRLGGTLLKPIIR
ncbi:MAG: type II secretion system protein GspN [Desulfuromonadales bacterium]|nr:type II secretion system protein GspN [Desulfuromonadales bacterium]